MRLSWDDGFRSPVGKISPTDAKFYYDIGFRVVGINPGGPAGIVSATEADIKYARSVLADNGLMPGPVPVAGAFLRPDPSEMAHQKESLKRIMEVAGKLGCPAIQTSIGGMHPKNVWLHHPDNFTRKAMDAVVSVARELAPVARDNGVVLCPETTQWTVVHNIQTMKEFVDRVDSPYVRVTFDFVNHMDAERVYDSGRYIRCAVETLGDRIGIFHVKDVKVQDVALVVHIDEAPMGTGLLDHKALIEVSTKLEPWKTFSLEHIRDNEALKAAYQYIQKLAESMGHKWTDPKVTQLSYQKRQARLNRAPAFGEDRGRRV
jgi:sugar phosphate isomerase/epimerase